MSKLHEHINNHRVFPRVIAGYIAYMFYHFHMWFTSVAITNMSEWAIVGYGTVLATVVGFAKFYMETGNESFNNS